MASSNSCSVVPLEWREHWKQIPQSHMVVLEVGGHQWACHCQKWHVLSASTMLRLLALPWVHYPKWVLHFIHFPGLRHSASLVLCNGTDNYWLWALCPSQVKATQATWSWVRHSPRWAIHLMDLSSYNHSVCWLHQRAKSLLCLCLLEGADIRLLPSWLMWTVHEHRQSRLQICSMLGAWWEMSSLGPR